MTGRLLLAVLLATTALPSAAADVTSVCVDYVPVLERGPTVGWGSRCITDAGAPPVPEVPGVSLVPTVDAGPDGVTVGVCWEGPDTPCVRRHVALPTGGEPPRIVFEDDGYSLRVGVCFGSSCRIVETQYMPFRIGYDDGSIYYETCGPYGGCDRKTLVRS